MRQARRIAAALAGFLAFAAIVEPAAAQTSINEELIWGLNNKLLYVAVPITVLVEGILIYTIWEYRNNDEPQPTRENRRLEITWTVATAIILLFVGVASYQVLGSAFIGGATASGAQENVEGLSQDYDEGAQAPAEENAVQIEVVSQKYFWQFNHMEADGELTESDTLVMPANTTVYLYVTSTDWLHAFHAPDLALKQDAFPGEYHTIKTEVYEQGTYQLYCAEYCGVGHSGMLGTIEVVSQEEYQQYLEENADSGSGGGNASGNSSGNASGNASAALAASPA